MAWIRNTYYKRNVRIGNKVHSEYIGAGLMGAMAARLDQLAQSERAELRAERQAIIDLAAQPVEMRDYLAQTRQIVALILEANGYHQHKRQWRKQRMSKQPMPKQQQSAPLAGPATMEDWAQQTVDAMVKHGATDAERKEYQRLLGMIPGYAVRNGDLARIAQREICKRYEGQPIVEESIKHIATAMRRDLSGAHPSPLELLLVEAVLLGWHDWYSFELIYAAKANEGGMSLDACEQYERLKASKQRRYQSAIETLARVRRLLHLPAVQVNIGGQQVIANEVHQSTKQ